MLTHARARKRSGRNSRRPLGEVFVCGFESLDILSPETLETMLLGSTLIFDGIPTADFQGSSVAGNQREFPSTKLDRSS